MRVHVGDRLIPDGDDSRAGVVIGLQNADGSPPYVVKWLSDGHIALVFPGPYTRVVPGGATEDVPGAAPGREHTIGPSD
ncbi:MAG TPA: DUF1918 domain-containing protein [Streptosporangiaceae bacterium]|jgi:hypothetical protein